MENEQVTVLFVPFVFNGPFNPHAAEIPTSPTAGSGT
jgi:hypothetical protein